MFLPVQSVSSDRANNLDDAMPVEKTRTAANGKKFTALSNGNTSGYESQPITELFLLR